MGWRLAKSLEVLRAQVNAAAPKRSKVNDGTIGDTAHSARKSDHNPNARGVVQALDITHDPKNGMDSYALAETLRKSEDGRIKYVISNGRIFSSTESPWKWRKYSGANKHSVHVHISVSDKPAFYDNESKWDIGRKPVAKPQLMPEAEPEPDDTKPHAAEPETAKTGISEGAKVGVGAGILGLLTQAWDAITQAPETIVQAALAIMQKPAFWVFAVVIGAGIYVWWRRKQMKVA